MSWIKIHDSLLEWEWFDDARMVKAWLYFLVKANYKDIEWHGITIRKGQFVTTTPNLMADLDLTERETRTVLQRLEKSGEIVRQIYNRYSIITICKYDTYQSIPQVEDEEERQSSDTQATLKSQSSDTQASAIIEYKNTRLKEKDTKVSQKKDFDLSFVAPELFEKFNEFLAMRKQIKKPLKTQRGVTDRYKELMRLSNEDIPLALKIIDQSLSREWESFYELKEQYQRQTSPPQPAPRKEKIITGANLDDLF